MSFGSFRTAFCFIGKKAEGMVGEMSGIGSSGRGIFLECFVQDKSQNKHAEKDKDRRQMLAVLLYLRHQLVVGDDRFEVIANGSQNDVPQA